MKNQKVKKDVAWKSFSDGNLTGEGVHKNRTVIIDENGTEWISYCGTPKGKKIINGLVEYRSVTIRSENSIHDIINRLTAKAQADGGEVRIITMSDK